jgi:hypothetical protein
LAPPLPELLLLVPPLPELPELPLLPVPELPVHLLDYTADQDFAS